MIKVILADDHHLVRQGIRSLLEKTDDIEVVAEAENGYEAVNLTRELSPDILLLDINMPRLNGIQVAEQIRSMDLETKIVILSMHTDEILIRQALRNGIRGYLLKRSVMAELLLAIRAAYRGELYLSPAISDIITSDFLSGQAESEMVSGIDQLSSREREVLKLIAEGYSNKDIADTMYISKRTVEKHRASLMKKLKVKDLAGLIRYAIKHGLIFLDD